MKDVSEGGRLKSICISETWRCHSLTKDLTPISADQWRVGLESLRFWVWVHGEREQGFFHEFYEQAWGGDPSGLVLMCKARLSGNEVSQ